MATETDADDAAITELQSLNSNPESQDVSMETNMSKMSEAGANRKEIEINMGMSTKDADDPLDRLEPCLACVRALSPVRGLLYMRLTLEHHYQRYKSILWMATLGLVVIAYFFYLGAAFRRI